MRGGHKPVLRQKWFPSDFQNDPFVKGLLKRRAFVVYTFYRQFLDMSFIEGGSLPLPPQHGDDPPTTRYQLLADAVSMEPRLVADAVSMCIRLGKLVEKDGRLFHHRVLAQVQDEIEFRRNQSEAGARGGRPRKEKATLSDTETPPSPTPSPTPTTGTDNEQRIAAAPPKVPPVQAEIPGTEGERPRQRKAPAEPKKDSVAVGPLSWSTEACDDFKARFGGMAPGGVIGRYLRPLVEREGWAEVRPRWKRCLDATDVRFAMASPAHFAATFGEWGNGGPKRVDSRPAAPNLGERINSSAEEALRLIRGGQ